MAERKGSEPPQQRDERADARNKTTNDDLSTWYRKRDAIFRLASLRDEAKTIRQGMEKGTISKSHGNTLLKQNERMQEELMKVLKGSGSKASESVSLNAVRTSGIADKYVSDLKGKFISLIEPKEGVKPGEEGYRKMYARIVGVGDRKGYYRFDIWEQNGNKRDITVKVYNTQESQKFLYELSQKYKDAKIL